VKCYVRSESWLWANVIDKFKDKKDPLYSRSSTPVEINSSSIEKGIRKGDLKWQIWPSIYKLQIDIQESLYWNICHRLDRFLSLIEFTS